MNKPILLDTDIIIDYLRNYKPAVLYLEHLNQQLLLSALTIAELYAGIRNAKEKDKIEKFLQVFEIIPLDHPIAQMGGAFRSTYGKSNGTGLVDALIAATALQKNAELATLNSRHYPMLNVIKPYSKSV